MNYPLVLTPDDNGTLLVTCPDLPEVTTFGEDRDEALQRAAAAIEEALAARIANRENIPSPSRANGRPRAILPFLTVAKVNLYLTARRQKVTKAVLGRRLNLFPLQVDRLFNVRHASKIEEIDRALRAMGKRLEARISNATE